jgi:hypothetical protein
MSDIIHTLDLVSTLDTLDDWETLLEQELTKQQENNNQQIIARTHEQLMNDALNILAKSFVLSAWINKKYNRRKMTQLQIQLQEEPLNERFVLERLNDKMKEVLFYLKEQIQYKKPKLFKNSTFTEIPKLHQHQIEVLNHLDENHNVFWSAKTSSGKTTLASLLPLKSGGLVIIVVPTDSLLSQVNQNIYELMLKSDYDKEFTIFSVETDPRKLIHSRVILTIHSLFPRMIEYIKRNGRNDFYNEKQLPILFLDEADSFLERDEYRTYISKFVNSWLKPRVILASATLDEKHTNIVPNLHIVNSSFRPIPIEYYISKTQQVAELQEGPILTCDDVLEYIQKETYHAPNKTGMGIFFSNYQGTIELIQQLKHKIDQDNAIIQSHTHGLYMLSKKNEGTDRSLSEMISETETLLNSLDECPDDYQTRCRTIIQSFYMQLRELEIKYNPIEYKFQMFIKMCLQVVNKTGIQLESIDLDNITLREFNETAIIAVLRELRTIEQTTTNDRHKYLLNNTLNIMKLIATNLNSFSGKKEQEKEKKEALECIQIPQTIFEAKMLSKIQPEIIQELDKLLYYCPAEYLVQGDTIITLCENSYNEMPRDFIRVIKDKGGQVEEKNNHAIITMSTKVEGTLKCMFNQGKLRFNFKDWLTGVKRNNENSIKRTAEAKMSVPTFLLDAFNLGMAVYSDTLPSQYRFMVLKYFANGRIPILLCDAGASRGLNLPFSEIILCGQMSETEAVQMSGRAGRPHFGIEKAIVRCHYQIKNKHSNKPDVINEVVKRIILGQPLEDALIGFLIDYLKKNNYSFYSWNPNVIRQELCTWTIYPIRELLPTILKMAEVNHQRVIDELGKDTIEAETSYALYHDARQWINEAFHIGRIKEPKNN